MNVDLQMSMASMMRINTYRDVSFAQAKQISKIAEVVSKNPMAYTGVHNQTVTFNMLQDIDFSIRYRRPLWRKFLDLITFQFIKVIYLKGSVDRLINDITNIIGNNPNLLPININRPNPVNVNNQPPVTVPSSEKISGSWQDTAEFKADLVLRAWNHFKVEEAQQKQMNAHNPQWIDTAEKVNEFFKAKSELLNDGHNVAVPFYYHATRGAVDLIADSQNLKQSTFGVQGAGVYYSTHDESLSGYGDYTYALDPALVEPLVTTYQEHSGSTHQDAVWMCAKQDIKLDSTRVAYVIVPDDGAIEQKLQKFWQNGEFYVDLIKRPVANWIHRCIQAVHVHSVPLLWKHNTQGYRAPTNSAHLVAD